MSFKIDKYIFFFFIFLSSFWYNKYSKQNSLLLGITKNLPRMLRYQKLFRNEYSQINRNMYTSLLISKTNDSEMKPFENDMFHAKNGDVIDHNITIRNSKEEQVQVTFLKNKTK